MYARQVPLDPHTVQESVTTLSIYIATTTWVVYDYFLTFSDEVHYMWGVQASTITVLLFLLRYGVLFRQALLMSQFLHLDVSPNANYVWCNVFVNVWSGVDIIMYIAVVVLAVLRIYAVSVRRNVHKAVIVLALGLTFALSDAYGRTIDETVEPTSAPLLACYRSRPPNRLETARLNISSYISAGCLLLCELIVQILTWERAFEVKRKLKVNGSHQPMLIILIREGALYYLFFLFWSILSLFVTSYRIVDMTPTGLAIAVCRVLLKMRRVQTVRATQKTPITPQSQMLDTTQMYLSEVGDDEAMSAGFTRFSDC